MDLEKKFNKEIDIYLLEKLSSMSHAKKIILKFEKYSGKIPTEQDFYKTYLRYSEYEQNYGKIFNIQRAIRRSVRYSLNSPKLVLKQFKIIEDYLFHKKIIGEKIYF